MGELEPLAGTVVRDPRALIAVVKQHHVRAGQRFDPDERAACAHR
jgi:hypothetical protein